VAGESSWGRKYYRLSEAIGNLIEDFSLVRFTPLNVNDEENIGDLLMTIDNIIQYGEDCDVKVRDDFDPPEEEEDDDPEKYMKL